MQAVDLPFLRLFHPYIKRSFEQTFKQLGFTPEKFDTRDKFDYMMKLVLDDMCLTRHRLYIHTPGIWDVVDK